MTGYVSNYQTSLIQPKKKKVSNFLKSFNKIIDGWESIIPGNK